MNEAETRAEHVEPALKAAGWGVVEGSSIRREFPITLGRLQGAGKRSDPEIADYVLVYRNTKLAVVEAKRWTCRTPGDWRKPSNMRRSSPSVTPTPPTGRRSMAWTWRPAQRATSPAIPHQQSCGIERSRNRMNGATASPPSPLKTRVVAG